MGKPTSLTPVKGHPGIFRKGSRYQVRYRHHGTQRAKSFRTLTQATRFKAKVDSGDTTPTSREPFKSYAARWIDTYSGRTARGVSDVTRESYRDALDRFAVPFFKTTPLERIDPPRLRAFIAHLAKHGLAPASVRRAYAPVRALLATAYDDGQLRTNPATGVRVIVKDTRTRIPKWLTSDQTKALLAEMPAEHSDLALLHRRHWLPHQRGALCPLAGHRTGRGQAHRVHGPQGQDGRRTAHDPALPRDGSTAHQA